MWVCISVSSADWIGWFYDSEMVCFIIAFFSSIFTVYLSSHVLISNCLCDKWKLLHNLVCICPIELNQVCLAKYERKSYTVWTCFSYISVVFIYVMYGVNSCLYLRCFFLSKEKLWIIPNSKIIYKFIFLWAYLFTILFLLQNFVSFCFSQFQETSHFGHNQSVSHTIVVFYFIFLVENQCEMNKNCSDWNWLGFNRSYCIHHLLYHCKSYWMKKVMSFLAVVIIIQFWGGWVRNHWKLKKRVSEFCIYTTAEHCNNFEVHVDCYVWVRN